MSDLRKAKNRLWAGLMAIKPLLDEPYKDDPRWTPWSRFVEQRLMDLCSEVDAVTSVPLASRERVAEVLSSATRGMDYKRWETPQGMLPFADALLAAGVFRDEAEVKAEALTDAADQFGVNVGTEGGEWWTGYRQAQREIIQNLSVRAAALRAGEPS